MEFKDFYRMKSVKKVTIALLVLALLTPCLFAGDIYVATNGNDTNNGSINSPYATIQKAVSKLDPGETCYIRGGSYHETVDLSGLNGTASSPITFTNYQDETVTMDGTIPITSSWSVHTGNIYKTTVPEDIWQLFVDGQPMTLARFPNVKAWGDDVWDADLSRRMYDTSLSFDGTLVDNPNAGHPDTLAGSGISFDGAIAVICTKTKAYNRFITDHTVGSDTFNYAPTLNQYETVPWYYIEGFQALDTAGEWFYEPNENTLYLYAEDGQNPTGRDIRAKNQTYALMGTNETQEASYIVLDGLRFFATGFHFEGNESVTIQNCIFEYPSTPRHTLGELVSPPGMYSKGSDNFVFRDNVVRRAEIEWDAKSMDYPIVENNLFSEISPAGGTEGEGNSVAAFRACFRAIIRRNTFDTIGCCNCFTIGHRLTGDGCLIEYNLFNRTSLINSDAMAIQFSYRPYDSVIRNNWFLNADKGSWRYDGKGSQTHGICYRNLTFGDVGTATIKGDYHEVYHNTGTISVRPDKGGNPNSLSTNNASTVDLTLAGIQSSNWDEINDGESLADQMRDPYNRDFRPKAGSVWVDAGIPIAGITLLDGTFVPGGINDDFLGSAPDIGTYEYGESNYWIPGRKLEKASMPVPPDGTTTAKLDADLMWLAGRDAISHDIYFGTSSGNLPLLSTQSNNIFGPGILDDNTEYFWRIDTVTATGTITGNEWSFKVQQPTRYAATTFYSIADTYVDDETPGISKGTDTQIKLCTPTTAGNGYENRHGYIKFNVDVPGNVLSAGLRLYANNGNARFIQVFSMTDTSWDEMTMTWNNRPQIDGVMLDTQNIDNNTWQDFDVSNAISDSGLVSFGLIRQPLDSRRSVATKESAYPPELIVTYEATELGIDINGDGVVNTLDFAIIASQWLNDCGYPGWCGGADINLSGEIGLDDLNLFAISWLDGL
jgi:hypothetical protein